MFIYGKDFVRRHNGDLKRFLKEAHQHNRSVGLQPSETIDGGAMFLYERGDWAYQDAYYGGEPYGGDPFGGTMTVSYLGGVCWMMVYFGRIIGNAKKDDVNAALTEALQRVDQALPVRGPKKHLAKNGLSYHNSWNGELRFFSGREFITDKNGAICYELYYHGGFVSLR